jgi:hypothetical protein
MWKHKAKDLFLSLVGGLWVSLAPIHSILAAVFGIVALDFLAGVYRSVVVDRESFRWGRVTETLVKTLPYLFVVLAGFGADHLIGVEGLWLTRTFALMVSSKEIRSIGRNTGFDLEKAMENRPKPKNDEGP